MENTSVGVMNEFECLKKYLSGRSIKHVVMILGIVLREIVYATVFDVYSTKVCDAWSWFTRRCSASFSTAALRWRRKCCASRSCTREPWTLWLPSFEDDCRPPTLWSRISYPSVSETYVASFIHRSSRLLRLNCMSHSKIVNVMIPVTFFFAQNCRISIQSIQTSSKERMCTSHWRTTCNSVDIRIIGEINVRAGACQQSRRSVVWCDSV